MNSSGSVGLICICRMLSDCTERIKRLLINTLQSFFVSQEFKRNERRPELTFYYAQNVGVTLFFLAV